MWRQYGCFGANIIGDSIQLFFHTSDGFKDEPRIDVYLQVLRQFSAPGAGAMLMIFPLGPVNKIATTKGYD